MKNTKENNIKNEDTLKKAKNLKTADGELSDEKISGVAGGRQERAETGGLDPKAGRK